MNILSRRLFLGTGLLVVGAAGMGAGLATTHGKHPVAKAGPSAPAQPDPANLLAAVHRELDLIARLQRAGRQNPSSLVKVRVLIADHRAHAAALQALLSSPVPASTVPTTTAPAAAVHAGDLLRWEKAAAAQTAQASAAAHGALAALLASIAACEYSHVAWLS